MLAATAVVATAVAALSLGVLGGWRLAMTSARATIARQTDMRHTAEQALRNAEQAELAALERAARIETTALDQAVATGLLKAPQPATHAHAHTCDCGHSKAYHRYNRAFDGHETWNGCNHKNGAHNKCRCLAYVEQQ